MGVDVGKTYFQKTGKLLWADLIQHPANNTLRRFQCGIVYRDQLNSIMDRLIVKPHPAQHPICDLRTDGRMAIEMPTIFIFCIAKRLANIMEQECDFNGHILASVIVNSVGDVVIDCVLVEFIVLLETDTLLEFRDVLSLKDTDKIAAVTYGMTLPKKYLTEMQAKLAVAQAQMDAIVERMNAMVSDNAEQ